MTKEEFTNKVTEGMKMLEEREHDINLQERINKALHRIQLLQMDGEVTVSDLGFIVRELRGDESGR